MNALIELHSQDAERAQLESVREAYLDSLIVDAGLITDPQLSYFAQIISKLKIKYGTTFDNTTKIAVLHHHIGHLWRQQIEMKNFESTIDAAQLKQALIETSFDIVLHGHKHTNHVGIEGGLIPVSENTRFDPLCVISGGTVGGNPRLNDHQTFKLLQLSSNKSPRTEMVIMEIPIRETADPAAAIHRDAKIYNAPLSQRLPNLHKIISVKSAIDEFVLSKCAPERNSSRGVVAKDPSADPINDALFSQTQRYRCHSFLDDGRVQTFYEVILATEEIGFRTFSRLHWLVTDILGGNRERKKVVIVIGNLQNTHFSEAESPNEVVRSIAALQEFLRPALESKVLEIRDYVLTQTELTPIIRNTEIDRGLRP